MFSEEKLSEAEQKKQKKTQPSIGIKSFYSNTPYGLKYETTASVKYLLKCS